MVIVYITIYYYVLPNVSVFEQSSMASLLVPLLLIWLAILVAVFSH